ncbi:hypothetical protein SAMN05720766_105141 [Fibrobacter sp. UWH9]|uniref:DUF6680 family protein n=1 Tax=Fibrobacter sp. UWH9 TaxID=1896213 RepID=UPI000917E0F5|nr:DUF6680 family protein [Fibrobacter sp. UWH9]SHG94309.1 hypothetical protein SAMN05720766_105141 [Fibrobacter sp. UWH9]
MNNIDWINILSLAGTALVSGLIATLVTLYWQRKTASKNQKLKIFEVVMHYRYDIAAEENVKALNTVDVFFYKNQSVRKAYANFIAETNKGQNANIADKYLRLLEEMARSLGLKNIRWECIKNYYYPTGLANRIKATTDLINTQIISNVEIAKYHHDRNESDGSDLLPKIPVTPRGNVK